MNARIACRLFGSMLGLAVAACQGSDLLLPGDASPSRLRAVGGDGQEGTIGTKLPDPLVVRVSDAASRPVSNVFVRFQTEVPGAQVEPALVATDDSGYAAVEVRLGSTEGIQEVDALLDGDSAAEVRTTFQLTAVAPTPDDRGRDGHEDDVEDEREDDEGDNGRNESDDDDEGGGSGGGGDNKGGNEHGGEDD